MKTDFLIIGGGIAGCIVAMALAESNQVTLIDKLARPQDKIGESLAPAAQRILKELNLLADLEQRKDDLYRKNLGMQSCWGSDQLHIVDHLRNPDGFVRSLNRKAFEEFLRESAEKRGVRCIWNSKLQHSSLESQWKIKIQSNESHAEPMTIYASYVIDASGRQSHFARSIGIKRQTIDKLIACWISLPNTAKNTMSTISASENGWWYSSVVPNNKRIIAYHTDADIIEKTRLKTLESFLAIARENKEISNLIGSKQDGIKFHGTVAANSTILEQVAGPRWAAIGDAAISFDPLSSQGMFNAMASSMQLKNLIETYKFKEELAKIHQYQTYQIWNRYLDHRRMFYQAEIRWKHAEFWQRRH